MVQGYHLQRSDSGFFSFMSMLSTYPLTCLFFSIDRQYPKNSWNRQIKIQLYYPICHCFTHIIEMGRISFYHAAKCNKGVGPFLTRCMMPVALHRKWYLYCPRHGDGNDLF